MLRNTSRSFLIQHPRIDGTDCGRFFNEIANACHENVAEARALERRIADEIVAPAFRWLLNKGQQLGISAHRRRWQNLYD